MTDELAGDGLGMDGGAGKADATPGSEGAGKTGRTFTRRTFVKVGLLAGAGLTLGVSWRVWKGPGLPPTDAAFAPNALVRIESDGSITVMVSRSEMGQGVATALPQLVADELDVPWDRVGFAFAPAHGAYGAVQATGGSTSVMDSWEPLRRAGATARQMLVQAAANRWGVETAALETRDAMVVGPDGSTFGYGELAVDAAQLEVPEEVPLRSAGARTFIGESMPRLDVPEKTTGAAVFGIDAGPDDARVAVIARPPVFGGTVRSFDPSAALAVAGVDEVVEVDSGVAVVARGYWEARMGRDALVVEWDDGPHADLDDAGIFGLLESAVAEGGRTVTDEGDVEAALAIADPAVTGGPIEATYRLPYLAHSTMEPMNCTAWVRDGRCTVWAPTQFQNAPGLIGGGARQVAAAAAGVDADDTEVHTTYLGGGFGRRAERDFVHEAAQLAGRIEGPVKVVWSREDDTQHDFYRPASYHELRATLDDDGALALWDHSMACQSIMERLVPPWVPGFARRAAGRRDPTSTEGASNQPYDVPNERMRYARVDLPIPVGFWRSVGHTHTGFVVESFIDEVAHEAGRDPFEYRRDLLTGHPRHRAVLEAVAEAADWGGDVEVGRARGIAVVESFGSYAAQVAEVSVENGRPVVHRVWCAIDCGTVLNPRIVEAQMESGIVYGLTAALYGEVNIRKGRVVQSNFHDYPMLRMREAPEIHVVLVPSGDAPGGVGEPGVPPIAPAVTNAIFALTGERIRELPIRL